MTMDRICLEATNVEESLGTVARHESASVRTHEVSVKALGLKGLASGMKSSVRVVLALLRDGVVTSKTAMSTEFGNLTEEARMSMAVWEDKDTFEASLCFDAELRISQQGTVSNEETDFVVALVDTSVSEPTLQCTPLGLASLRIKAVGEVNHTTQLVPVQGAASGQDIPSFRVNNPFFKPSPCPGVKSTRFGQKKDPPPRLFSRKKFGIKASSRKKSKRESNDKAETKTFTNIEECLSPNPGQIAASLDAGVLLLDVCWKHKETDLETVLESWRLPTLANSSQYQHHNASPNPTDGVIGGSKTGSTSSSHSDIVFQRRQSGQVSMSEVTDTTRLASNTTKRRPRAPNQTNAKAVGIKQQPLQRKKRFWVVPLKAFRRRFKKADTSVISTAATPGTIPNAVALPHVQSSNSDCESTLTGSPKVSLGKFDSLQEEEKIRVKETFASSDNSNADSKPYQSLQRKSVILPDGELSPMLGRTPESEFEARGSLGQVQGGASAGGEPAALTERETCATSVAKSPFPAEVFFADETSVGNSTITMTKLKPQDTKPEPEEQLGLFSIFPECARFDGDPSMYPVLEGYGNLVDGEETVATLETIDSYLKQKEGMQSSRNASSTWWNEDDMQDMGEETLASIGGFEYHADTDILRTRIRGFTDDDITYVPRPEDVVWTELYKGCHVRSLEQLTDGFVLLPEQMTGAFKGRCALKDAPESPTVVSSTNSDMRSQAELSLTETSDVRITVTSTP